MEVVGVLMQLGVMIALFAGIAIAASRSRRQMREAWNHVANRLGLTLGYGSPTGSLLRLTGTIGHVAVRMYQERVQSGKNSSVHTYLELATDPPIPGGVNVAVERMGHGVAKTLNIIDDVEIGHDEFDRRYLIDANDADALALLGGPSRFAAAELLERGAKIEHGRIRLFVRKGLRDGAYLESLIRATVARAEVLAEPLRLPPAARLARNALHDPVGGVRLRNLEMLLRRHRATDAARDAARLALDDADPRVVVLAAAHVGAEAAPHLVAVAGDASRPEGSRIAALGALVRCAPDHADLPRLAQEAWHDASDEARVAGLMAGAALRPELRARLGVGGWIEVAARSPFAALQRAACEAAVAARATDAEPALIALLDAAGPVRIAAIQALAVVGSLAAVRHLLPLTKGLMRDGDERRAATRAIASIQARCGGGEVGSLAVVQAEGGELSVAAEAGRGAAVQLDAAEEIELISPAQR